VLSPHSAAGAALPGPAELLATLAALPIFQRAGGGGGHGVGAATEIDVTVFCDLSQPCYLQPAGEYTMAINHGNLLKCFVNVGTESPKSWTFTCCLRTGSSLCVIYADLHASMPIIDSATVDASGAANHPRRL
jgi:hypothetical protein